MTNTKHTPAPWQLPTGYERHDSSGHDVIPLFTNGYPFDTIAIIMPRKECNANARLIAAAPELLEALTIADMVMRTVSTSLLYIGSNTEKVITSAIAKAKGE